MTEASFVHNLGTNYKSLGEKLNNSYILKSISADGNIIIADDTVGVQDMIDNHNPDALTEDKQRIERVDQLISDNFAGFDLDDMTATQALLAIKILYIRAGLAGKDGIIK